MSNQEQLGRFMAVKDSPLSQQTGDQAETLRAYVAQNPEVKQPPTEPDYRALWMGLKAELQQARLEWIKRVPNEPWCGPRSRALELMDEYELRQSEPVT